MAVKLVQTFKCLSCDNEFKSTQSKILTVKYDGKPYGLPVCDICKKFSVIDIDKFRKLYKL